MTNYFDNHASTRTDPRVIQRMQDSMKKNYANPHASEHIMGLSANACLRNSLHEIADFFGCDGEEIVITSGATESNNLAIKSLCNRSRLLNKSKNRILVSAIEHKSVLDSADYVTNLGYIVDIIPVDSLGVIDLDAYKKLLGDDVLLVSVMLTNNEIGSLQAVSQLSELAHEHQAYFHCDAAQSMYEHLDVYDLNVDLLSFTGHKAYGPKGIGLLYVSHDIRSQLTPLFHGGGQQEGLRPGTQATFLIEGLAEALSILKKEKTAEAFYLQSLRNAFILGLDKEGIDYQIHGGMEKRHPGNLNLSLPFDAREFLGSIRNKAALSTGSACNGMNIDTSYVLAALGISSYIAKRAIRIGFGRFNTLDEVEHLMSLIVEYNKIAVNSTKSLF